MIAVNATDGVLRVYVERRIPSALAGQWDLARIGKLTELINEFIEAAELVDAVAVSPRDRFANALGGAMIKQLCPTDVSTRE